MTFTHNNTDDTIIERDGNTIEFSFIGNPFTLEEQDRMVFTDTQEELLFKLEQYFSCGNYADIFDNMTLPGQDALWNALVFMANHHIYL